MKNLLIPFGFLILTGCSDAPKTNENLAHVYSVQTYSTPRFTDSASFKKIREAGPVIDKLFQDHAAKNHFPSITYGIIVGNELVYAGSTGSSNLDKKTPATSKTLYRIASMSKSFTAMAILKLRDEGKLSLSDPVTKFIPDFRGAGSLTSDSGPITVLHLLTMSAGFPEDNSGVTGNLMPVTKN